MNIAVIFAAGTGERMKNDIPKQFIEINGKPILIYTLQIYQKNAQIDMIYLAVPNGYLNQTEEWINQYQLTKVQRTIIGGNSAQETIYKLLVKIREDVDDNPIVIIHDGVRPIVTQNTINENINCVKEKGNAVSVTPCYETIVVNDCDRGIIDVPYRKRTFAAQAPQGFYLDDVLDVHKSIMKRKNGYEDMVDTCTMYYELGKKIALVEGNRGNIKITTPEDIYMFKSLLENMPEIWE